MSIKTASSYEDNLRAKRIVFTKERNELKQSKTI